MSHTLTITPDNTGLMPTEITSIQFTVSANITSKGQAVAEVLNFLANVVNGNTVGGGTFS